MKLANDNNHNYKSAEYCRSIEKELKIIGNLHDFLMQKNNVVKANVKAVIRIRAVIYQIFIILE